MVRKARAPHVSLEAQLQQLTLMSDLDVSTESVEQLGPVIKSLDEARQQDEFLRQLRMFVHRKDEEIEVVCNENHQDFVSAVDELLIVRSGAVSLKHRINELNNEVQASGRALSKQKRALIEKQRVSQNIEEAVDVMQACLHVLEMSASVDACIGAQQYYSALRRLDELEKTHLKPLMQHEIAQRLMASIPATRENIRLEVTRQMKGWLFEVREKCGIVGRRALDAMEARQQRWRARSQKDPVLCLSRVNSPIEQVVNERVEVDLLDSIDFAPLYRCIHTYEVLGQREKLEENYHEDRKAQANLLLSQNLTVDTAGTALAELLQEVVGYFVVEHHVLHTTPPGFRTESQVEDVWETMCERVVDIVGYGLRDCRDARIYVDAKASVLTFIRTLESLGFDISRLNGLLLMLFRRYAQLLRERFADDYSQALAEAQHQPMIVSDKGELSKVLSVCWLREGEEEVLQSQPFPLSLPFSQTYPLCCMDIRSLVEQYYSFSSGFSQYYREIDDILRQSLNELLVQQISVNTRATVECTGNLSQVAQIIINVEHFQLACHELEVWLANSRNPNRGGKISLEASEHLATTREIAQNRIESAMFVKLDQFLDLLDYDWTAAQPRTATYQASAYLRDMHDWLLTMMESALVLLSPETKAMTYKSCYIYIANRLLNSALLDTDVVQVSPAALANIEMDVTYLYQTARNLSVEDMDGIFAQIRQTLAVILSDSVSEFALSPNARATKFSQAQPIKVAAILNKLVAYHTAKGPAHATLAMRRTRERDMVSRIISR